MNQPVILQDVVQNVAVMIYGMIICIMDVINAEHGFYNLVVKN
jgi:hypothetical protein